MAPSLQTAIAAHRFGLGEADLGVVGSDPRSWLGAQIGPADAPRGSGLLDTRQALEHVAAERALRQRARNPPPGTTAEQILAGHYREVIVADARSRLATAALTAASLRRAAAMVLDQSLHRLGPEGKHARPGRRVRARCDPAEHRRPLRDAARGLDDASGDAALSRQLAVGRPELARRRLRGAPRRAHGRGRARQRHQREPRPRGAGAAHAWRRERPRRRLHAGRCHLLRRGADRLAHRQRSGRGRFAVQPELARARAEDAARQALSRRPGCAAPGPARPGPASGDGALRLDQAGSSFRRRRSTAGIGRTAERGLPRQ